MMLADAMASGANPDAFSNTLINLWSWLWSLLMKSRVDSAAWAISFTINTWAAAIPRARITVYEKVHNLFVYCMKEICDAQLLEKAEKLTNEEGHREFRSLVYRLQKYTDRKDREFRDRTKARGVFWESIMWCAAMLSVIVIVFEWYRNIALVLLLPYPIFCIFQRLRGSWAKFRVRWMRNEINRSFRRIEKQCQRQDNEPPSMNELKRNLESGIQGDTTK